MDTWYDHEMITRSANKRLEARTHQIRVEYYEQRGRAAVQLSWEPVSSEARYWRGAYYNNTVLQGRPIVVQQDARINFNWGTDSPKI